MKLNPETLARASSHHAWRTVGIWAVILILGFGASGVLLSKALTTDFDFTNNPEAIRAQTLLQQKQLEQDVTPETFVMTGPEGATTDPAFTAKVNAALNDVRALDPSVVLQVPSQFPLSQADKSNPQVAALGPFASEDGTAVLFNVILVKASDQTATIVDGLDAIQAKYSTGGTGFYMLGEPTSTADFKKISEDDLKKGETIGVVVAIIVLLIVFGSLIAGVTPIIMGIFAIGVAFGVVGLLGEVWRWSFFVPNLMTMLGLAVGIDYSLFIVSRYREERRRGRDNLEAIGMSGATANRAVFFSGLTVVIALAGMLLVPTTIFRGLAGGAIIVVLISVALSMTLLPALMALFSDRLVKPGFLFGRGRTLEQGRAGGFWDRESRSVMKRPWVYLIVTASFLILLSVPYWAQSRADGVGRGMKKGFSGIEAIPDGIPTKDAFNVLVAKFPKESGAQSTAQVVIPGAANDPTIASEIEALDTAVAGNPAFAKPQPPQTSQDGTVTLVAIPFAGEATDSQSQAAVDAVTALRDQYVPQAFGQDSGVLVGGDTALTKDFFDISNKYTPIVILLVLGLSFILLTVVFRSIVVPAKAIVMNLLSVGAAYGLDHPDLPAGGPLLGEVDRRSPQLHAGPSDRIVAPAVPVLDPVRPVDGLPGVPAEPDPRGVRQDLGQLRGGCVRPADHGRDHHRRRRDHGGRLRGVRERPDRGAAGDGLRPRGRRLPRRDDRAVGPGALGDEAAR